MKRWTVWIDDEHDFAVEVAHSAEGAALAAAARMELAPDQVIVLTIKSRQTSSRFTASSTWGGNGSRSVTVRKSL